MCLRFPRLYLSSAVVVALASSVSLLLLLCLAVLALSELPCSAFGAGGRDFYRILGVSRTANDRAIKKAYRSLAKLHHPDRPLEAGQTKEEANKKFQDIGAAYETLIDKEKRRVYDQGGEELLQKQGQQGGGGGQNPFDIFGQMFGGGHRQHGHGGGDPQERRGADIELDLPVTLEELYKGKVFEVSLKQQHLCPACRGTGARKESDVVQCPHCRGQGIVIKMHQIGVRTAIEVHNARELLRLAARLY
jgi:DnaJ-related protein SCJ1